MLLKSDRLIIHALLANPERRMTQAEFAVLAGLAPRTLTMRLPVLRKARLLARGRWAFGPGLGVALVAAIDGDRVAAAVVDANGTPHFKASEQLPEGIRTAAPADVLAVAAEQLHASWRLALAGHIEGHRVTPSDLRGICLALPTAIGRDETSPQVRGYALAHNGWRTSPVEELLRPHLPQNLRQVPVDALNDANCDALAVAFHHCRSTDGKPVAHSEILVAVRLSVGVGAGIVKLVADQPDVFRLNASTLIVGSEGLAGELGHLPTSQEVRAAINRARGPLAPLNDLPCSCGARNHLEGRVGVHVLLDRLRRTDPQLVPPDRPIFETVASLVGRPTDLVRGALRDTGRAVGVALNGAVLILDPAHIVFTGPLGVPQVCEAAEAHCLQSQRIPNRVTFGCAPEEIRDDTSLVGAGVAVLRKQVLKPIEGAPVSAAVRPRTRPRPRRRPSLAAGHRPHNR